MCTLRQTSKGGHLIAYFRSGWAFLVPYLFFYLLYSFLRLPVNSNASTRIPSLVHIYWLMHGLHLVAGAIALKSYWSYRICQSNASANDILWKIAPWLLLSFLILIPGVYLEMPSDPWAHFSRINEWNNIATPLDNSDWKKSSSLLAYSFVASCRTAPAQLAVFNVFYITCCLLYYWQYFRLAQSLGFSDPQSFVAVLANFVMFGNNIFGFHRYYGMSTTVVAQIGVLALTRWLVMKLRENPEKENSQNASDQSPQRFAQWPPALAYVFATITLITMNHVQGLLMVAVSSVTILCWRFARGSPWRPLSLLAGIILVNVLIVHLWPRHPNIDTTYRPYGWLTSYYGFNILQIGSPAYERTMQIIGILGLINFLAGVMLIFRRPLVGWLTVAPLLVVCLPMFALPFTDVVSRFGPPGYDYIASYSRLLLGIPAGLAICAIGVELRTIGSSLTKKGTAAGTWSLPHQGWPCSGLVLILMLLTSIPTSAPYFNRFWHQFMQVPHDLSEHHINPVVHFPAFPKLPTQAFASERAKENRANPPILTTPGIGFVIASFGQSNVVFRNKWMIYPQISTPVDRMDYLVLAVDDAFAKKTPAFAVVPDFNTLISPYSFAGQLSGHWPSCQVALEQAGSYELMQILQNHYGYQIAGKSNGVTVLRSD